jgi:internalin A
MAMSVTNDSQTTALARIEQAQKDRLTHLDLSDLGLTNVPHIITVLKPYLKSLNLSSNNFVKFPTVVLFLDNLTSLSLMSNKLHTVPARLATLTLLEELNLGDNRLAGLPLILRRLKRLRTLSLWANDLAKLPACVTDLSSLRGLYLWNNELSELPSTIGKLDQLEELDLGDNPVSALPNTFTRLSKLRRLDLSKTALEEFPDVILTLLQLTFLDLSGTDLRELPEALRALTSLEELYLHQIPNLNLPIEILGPTRFESSSRSPDGAPAKPAQILEYYFRIRGGRRPLNEVKLVLVGFGGVGKTSLVRRLVIDRFDAREAKTEGINRTTWPIRLQSGEDIRLHIWDFGGQEIMHATHQFFLTQRSLYLLVLSGRQGREDADAEYWLNLITSFAADSSVIIVLNKIIEHRFDVNRSALRNKFPQIHDFVETDCEDRTGINRLRNTVLKETDALPHLRDEFPSTWFSIKDRLSVMKENYLTFDGYRNLCRENGEGDPVAQETLAGFLHSLGIALNYKDDPRLRDTHVLNPRWVTEGVYKIINNERLRRQNG